MSSDTTLNSDHADSGLSTSIILTNSSSAPVAFDSVFSSFKLSTDESGPYDMVQLEPGQSTLVYGPNDGYSVTTGVPQVTTLTGAVSATAPVGTYTITTEVLKGTDVQTSATYSLTVTAPCTSGVPVASSLLFNTTQQITNDPDSSNAPSGADWATDTISRHIQIWQEGTTYCAQADDTGTFTTFGGTKGISPQSGSPLPEVVTGNIVGTVGPIATTIKPTDAGSWGSSAPAIDCTISGDNCSTISPWMINYFGTKLDYNWSWTYTSGANGTWVNALSGSHDDILHVAPAPDTIAPTLTVKGFTANGTAMDGSVESGYTLNTDGSANTHYAIQFAAGSVASEALQTENVELTLQPTGSQTADLQAFYSTNYPTLYEAYLKDAAAGTKPFAYIKTDGTTAIQILDGAQHMLASNDVAMSVPGNYPAGTYTVKGTIHDLAGNPTDVTFILNVVAPVTLSSIAITNQANKLIYHVGDTLDITGLVVTGKNSDATIQVEPITDSNVSGFDSTGFAHGQVLTITVGDKTTTYTVDIIHADKTTLTADINAEYADGSGRTTLKLTEADYTSATWSAYAGAIASAKGTEGDAGATQSAVNTTATAIGTAKAALVLAAPTVTSISPGTGTTAGDDTVTITGAGFTGTTAVNFGNAAATIIASTDTSITATSPAETAGIVDVTVTTASGTSVTSSADQFTYTKQSQTISFGSLADKTYGIVGFTVDAQANSGLGVNFTAQGNCTVSDGLGTASVFITEAGNCTVTAHQVGDDNYNAAPDVSQKFSIAPAPLTITAGDQSKVYGTSDPALAASYSGFVAGNTAASLTTPVSIVRATGENVGSYAITASGAVDSNYAIKYVPGTFTINHASATITLGGLSQDYDGTAKSATVTTNPSSLSTSVTYNGSATAPTSVGSYTVVATITNPNYTGTANGTLVISDVTPPVIALTGASSIDLAINNAFTDPGATATDAVDGTDAVTVSGTVNTAVAGTYTLTYTASDAAGNHATPVTRTVTIEAAALPLTITTPDESPLARVATIPSATEASTTSNGITATFNIPAGTTITGTSAWDGSLTLPIATTTYTAPSNSGFNDSVVSAIEMGAGNTPLTFSKGVRIVFAGQAGTLVGWSQNGVFTPITATCSADTQTVGDALVAGGDCTINSGSDLIVWTKHFTTFITYTQAAIPAPVSSGNGAPVGGGGGVGGGSVIPTFGVSNVTTNSAPSGNTGGEVLGAAAYNFAKTLQVGSRGNDVTQLQQFLTTDGDYSGPATGYFGALTQAAVKAYQTKSGIAPATGTVGPKTLTLLNKGNEPTTPEVLGASAYNFTQTLSVGSNGADVTALQNLLTKLGDYSGPVTGYFGALTKVAVMKYQTSHNVSATGTVGPLTRAALNKGI